MIYDCSRVKSKSQEKCLNTIAEGRKISCSCWAISTFSPVSLPSSNSSVYVCACVHAHVCTQACMHVCMLHVCACGMNLKCALDWHTSTYQFILCYASAQTRILMDIPSEDCEMTGLKVDNAKCCMQQTANAE